MGYKIFLETLSELASLSMANKKPRGILFKISVEWPPPPKVASKYTPILLKKSIDSLITDSEGVYLDATFGGGGHSTEILNKIPRGFLFAIDKDASSESVSKKILYPNFEFIRSDFRDIKQHINLIRKKLHQAHFITKSIDRGNYLFNGVLLDLGVSSHQFDTDSRGFSTRFMGDLDMRMDKNHHTTAKIIVNSYCRENLVRIFSEYGQLNRPTVLAKAIVDNRLLKKINTTIDLKNILKKYAPRGKESKFYAKVFQAFRIEVNGELSALKQILKESIKILKLGGRLVVISYHSLEDGIVKKFLKTGNFQGQKLQDEYGNIIRPYTPLYNKVITPTPKEILSNPRAKSAKMRIGTLNRKESSNIAL